MATTSERWFQRVVWVGIIANVALAVPTLLWPSEMLAFSRLPDAVPPSGSGLESPADPAQQLLRPGSR